MGSAEDRRGNSYRGQSRSVLGSLMLRRGFLEQGVDGIPLGRLSLDPADWTVYQGTNWTVSSTGGKLRAAHTGGSSVDFAGATATGLILIAKDKLRTFDSPEIPDIRYYMEFDEPSGNDCGVGFGLVNSATTPTAYGTRLHVRDGSATETVRDTSDLQNNSVGTVQTRRGGSACIFQQSDRAAYYVYTPGAAATDFNYTNRAGAFQTWDGDSVWLALFFSNTSLAARTVDISKLRVMSRRIEVP